jgi:hypothetical protein
MKMKKRYVVAGAAALLLTGLAIANWMPRTLAWHQSSQVVFQHPEFDLVKTGELEDATLATLSPTTQFVGEARFMYRGEKEAGSFGPQTKLFRPAATSVVGRLRELVATSRIVRHFRKVSPATSAVLLRSGTLLVMYDRTYRSTDGGRTFETVESLPLNSPQPDMWGFSEPTPRDEIYFGELTFQAQPHVVRVYKGTNDGRSWELKHTFPPGVTGHIHSIVFDRYRDRLWLCTGDTAEQSKLFYTDDDFATVHTLGEGDQGWRIMGLIPTKDALFWGSDGEPEGSNIYRYDFSSGQRTRLQHVGNPVWFGTQLADGTLALTSSYEPFIPYTAEKSPPKETALWLSRDGTAWFKTVTFPYRPDIRVGLNAVLGLSRANVHRGELYLSPFGPVDRSLTVQRYEVRWKPRDAARSR